ncbi:MAG: GNAT family N-acetyltransferase [Planctomycetota bacterium]
MTETLRIEPATIAVILPLRTEVLRDGQPAESAQFLGDDDPTTLHLAAISDAKGCDAVVGCVTLMAMPMPEDPTWTHQLRGMAVADGFRNQGIGGRLLTALRDHAPDLKIWCNARVPAQRFYERHGWTAVGKPFEIKHHGPHIRMTRRLSA